MKKSILFVLYTALVSSYSNASPEKDKVSDVKTSTDTEQKDKKSSSDSKSEKSSSDSKSEKYSSDSKSEKSLRGEVANVNGSPVYLEEVMSVMEQLRRMVSGFSGRSITSQASAAREIIIRQRLVSDIVKKEKFEEDSEYKKEEERAIESVRFRFYIKKLSKNIPDSLVKEEYVSLGKKIKESGMKEFDIDVVAVSSQKVADEIAESIEKGTGSFDKYARDKSEHKESSEKVGHYGFVNEKEVGEEASSMLKKMEVGNVSKVPVKMQLRGQDSAYYVIMRKRGEREVKLPSFEEMKSVLRMSAAQKKFSSDIEKSVKNSSIVRHENKQIFGDSPSKEPGSLTDKIASGDISSVE